MDQNCERVNKLVKAKSERIFEGHRTFTNLPESAMQGDFRLTNLSQLTDLELELIDEATYKRLLSVTPASAQKTFVQQRKAVLA